MYMDAELLLKVYLCRFSDEGRTTKTKSWKTHLEEPPPPPPEHNTTKTNAPSKDAQPKK